MSEFVERSGPAWLEEALDQWAERHEQSATMVFVDAAPELPYEWWVAMFAPFRALAYP